MLLLSLRVTDYFSDYHGSNYELMLACIYLRALLNASFHARRDNQLHNTKIKVYFILKILLGSKEIYLFIQKIFIESPAGARI